VSILQALKALGESVSSADVAKHLRKAATILSREDDTSSWLESDLVAPKVLDILRALPARCPPQEAVEVCAAAAAVLHNLFTGLHAPTHIQRFRTMLAAEEAACSALVHWCMDQPGSTEQLPPGQRVPWRRQAALLPAGAAGRAQSSLWTPFTNCACLLAAVRAQAPDAAEARHHKGALRTFRAAATPTVVERLLHVAIQYPCGRLRCQHSQWLSPHKVLWHVASSTLPTPIKCPSNQPATKRLRAH
jgi:hypothetical protein